MTIGIYTLNFEGTDKLYVGQSVNIENRYKQHLPLLRKSKGAPRLQKAYDLYGIPTLEVLIECSINELNQYEIYYIAKLDSFQNGFNGTNGGQFGSKAGHSGCKHTEDDYINMFIELVNSKHESIKQISDRTNWPLGVLKCLAEGLTHKWLEELYPEEYVELANRDKTPSYFKVKGEYAPILVGPDGTEYNNIGNVNVFARIHKIGQMTLSNIMTGKTMVSEGGWHLKDTKILNKSETYSNKPYKNIRVLDPAGNIHTIETSAKAFAKEQGLDHSSLCKVLKGKLTHTKGWKLLT